MNYQIKHRYANAILFECELPVDLDSGLQARHALEKATAAGANLAGAYLDGAYLDGANLDGTIWRPGVVLKRRPIQLYGLTWPVTVLDAHMQIGCQFHSLHDWEQFDDAAITAMDGRDALRFWRANKDALLGLARGAGRSFEEVAA